jgi:hypothetical protein
VIFARSLPELPPKPAFITDAEWNAIQVMDSFYRSAASESPHRAVVVSAIRKLLRVSAAAERIVDLRLRVGVNGDAEAELVAAVAPDGRAAR